MASRAAGAGRRTGRSGSEALLGRPWLLVAAVAVFLALPLLILGQTSESETRERLQAAQLESAGRAAAAVQRATDERFHNVRRSLEALALLPRPEDSLIAAAVQRSDLPTLQALADSVQRQLVRDVRHVYIAARGAAPTIADATVVVESPAGGGQVGRGLRDLPGNMAARVLEAVGQFTAFTTGTFAYSFPGTADAPSLDVVIATMSTRRAVAQRDSILLNAAPAAIIAELDTSRLFAEAAAAALGSADDAYLIEKGGDDRWSLIGRARGPIPFPLRDLTDDPFVQVLQGGAQIVRSGAADPLGGGARLIAAQPTPLAADWVLLLRDTTAIDREIDAVLGQLAAARYTLVGLLLIGAIVLARAASAQVRQRQALARANERAESASLHKSAFLSVMSHELRTPLNSINGFSDVLLSGIGGTLNDKQREYLADIRGSGEHLLALVNDVLDLSKVEAGKLELHPTEFDIRETVAGVHRVVAPLAAQKGQQLHLAEGEGGTVRLDEARLRQVLLNVVSNAVKYTPDGGTVTTSLARSDGLVRIAVQDTGIGVAPEDQSRVFEDFARVDSGYARTQQGTGLGLALARRLVRLMGGDITLASAPDQGSTFTISLPVADASGA